MLRRSATLRHGQAPAVYPFSKPFADTPHDQDRHRLNLERRKSEGHRTPGGPEWMRHGADGTGRGIALYRTHPLSKLKANTARSKENVPRIMTAMMQGFSHKSGRKMYYVGGKVPNPSLHPFLTGEPCPLYGWRVLDAGVIRQFEAPVIDASKMRYKPYVALHERRLLGIDAPADGGKPAADGKEVAVKGDGDAADAKPLLKRLFFWK
jgi:hypothetical protein